MLKRGRPIWQLFFEATLDLAFFNDVEMVTLVILVEDILTRSHVHHFEAVDQSQLIECLQAFEEFNLVKILKADVAAADRVLCNDVLEDITR